MNNEIQEEVNLNILYSRKSHVVSKHVFVYLNNVQIVKFS